MKKVALAEQYEIYLQNASRGVHSILADDLGVSLSSVEAFRVGLLPGSMKDGKPRAELAWIFPERNELGDVTGLMRRYANGKKFCVEGSKHGLYYAYNFNSASTKRQYSPGKHNWMRVDSALYPHKDTGCPVCGRKKYCMVSSADPENPASVICTQTRKGSRTSYEYGHLHILDEARNLCGNAESVMSFINPDGPVIIVEGVSDVMAAATIGLDAVGKPSNIGGLDILKKMPITGKEVWIIGENDVKANGDWPGKEGVERTYLALRGMCRTTRFMPPDGVKDLRAWVQRGLTLEQLTEYVKEHGDSSNDLGPDVFESDIAAKIAERFVDDRYIEGDTVTLRTYHGDWFRWNKRCYETFATDALRGQLYDFLDGKSFLQTDGRGNEKVVPYKSNRSKVNDIIDAFNRWSPVYGDPPLWLENVDLPDPVDLISFNNGLLDVKAYMDGQIVLHDPDPRMFSINRCPFDFDENVRSDFIESYLLDTYNGDQNAVDLIAEWTGYCMTSDLSYEKMLLIYGEPRSGKGTILDMMAHTIGKNLRGTSRLEAIGSRFGLEPLISKYLCTFGDVRNPSSETLSRALEVILQIVGGDSMSVDKKTVRGLPSIRMPLRFALAMNELPAFIDHSRALESRLLTLYHATSHISDQDPKLKRRILDDAAKGMMVNFALEGLARLRKNDRFSLPAAHDMVIKQFRVIAEPIATFIEDCCGVGEGKSCDTTCMYDAWVGWCKSNMRKPGLPPQFSKWLAGHVPTLSSRRLSAEGGRRHVYDGIELNEWAASKFLE